MAFQRRAVRRILKCGDFKTGIKEVAEYKTASLFV